jgi:UDP-N-acetylmuramyl pentapeptide phosphotransferase/UDP-N-acetylglucosamine-1-phosphate transferase
MKSVLILILLLLSGSFIMTWIFMIISRKNRILDIPNERSSHSEPTPKGGGVAIIIAWYAGISVLFFSEMIQRDLYFALLSGLLLAGISFIDDVIDLKPWIRLISQLITVIIAFTFLHGIKPFLLFGNDFFPAILLNAIIIILMVWFINLFNFLDGIDGYASLEAISLSLAFYLFTGQIICLILTASVLGFLIWNWPKAKIFMGDVGSTQLGFIIVVLGVYFHNEYKLSFIYWLMLSAPFWFDATLTLFRRWRNKEKLSQAHRNHVYQRLVQSGFSHLQVDICLVLINIFLIVLVIIDLKYTMLLIPSFILTMAAMYFITVYTDKRKSF